MNKTFMDYYKQNHLMLMNKGNIISSCFGFYSGKKTGHVNKGLTATYINEEKERFEVWDGGRYTNTKRKPKLLGCIPFSNPIDKQYEEEKKIWEKYYKGKNCRQGFLKLNKQIIPYMPTNSLSWQKSSRKSMYGKMLQFEVLNCLNHYFKMQENKIVNFTLECWGEKIKFINMKLKELYYNENDRTEVMFCKE